MLRKINGNKIKKMRGERSRRAIATASNGVFSDISLLSWENEDYKPKDDKLPVLLRALGCSFDDISDEVDLNQGVSV